MKANCYTGTTELKSSVSADAYICPKIVICTFFCEFGISVISVNGKRLEMYFLKSYLAADLNELKLHRSEQQRSGA